VSKPNEWNERVIVDIPPDKKLRMEYWTAFIDYIHEHDSTIKAGKPHTWHYLPFPVGRSYIVISAIIYAKDKKIAMQLYFHGPNAISYFKQIRAEKDEIEKEIGFNLVWDHTRSTARDVIIFKDNTDTKDIANWPEQHKWLYEMLEAFYRYLRKGSRIYLQITSSKIRKTPQMKPQRQYLEVQSP